MTTIILSTRVAKEQYGVVSHFNNLREDILTHDHSAGRGAPIGHGDLTDGKITDPNDTYIDHGDLKIHVMGAGSTPDTAGGDRGVHGLTADAYVAGSLSAQRLIQYGTAQTNNITAIGSYGDPVKYHYDQYIVVTFPTAFGGTPTVVLTARDSYTQSVRNSISSVSSVNFTARVGYAYEMKNRQQTNTWFDWIAIGPKP